MANSGGAAKRGVTIKDVAAHCGYSFKTVARVVNGVPSVDPAIRDRVKAAIDKLGYEPNVVARTLRGSASFTIGLVYEQPMADVQKGVLSACRRLGYGLQIIPVEHAAPKLGLQIVEAVARGKLAGVVLTPPISESKPVIAFLRQKKVPFAVIVSGNSRPMAGEPCVHVDDHAAAFEITNHLIELGHKAIGFIWGNPDHGSSQARYAGYVAALEAGGLKLQKSLAVAGEYTFESGVRCATELLARKADRPTAIVASNDEIAAGALIATRMLGFDVPGDVSIAGFEDSRFSREAWPPITTARQATENIAESATELLIHKMRSDAAGITQASETFERGFVPRLVVRASTARATQTAAGRAKARRTVPR